ncbi:MAG: hypothetical protein KAS32_14980 [Candidatus Peribacteraceae bacterium]|nr:hypothetical protein [Candidatus Peribacteraceae bacterium]
MSKIWTRGITCPDCDASKSIATIDSSGRIIRNPCPTCKAGLYERLVVVEK